MPKGPHPCVRDLKAVYTADVSTTVHVQVTLVSPDGDRRSGCTGTATESTRTVLPQALGGRELVVDNYTVFTPDGAKPPALRLCGDLGCHPAPTGCTSDSYVQALKTVDAPNHSYQDAVDCRGKWMVMQFSWPTGAASCGGDDKGCGSRLGDRYFFRAEKSGWRPIAEGAAGGCAVVQAREPDFPASMCENLAPLPASLHPHYSPAPSAGTGSASPTSR
ncbi:hypothetical protein WN71_029765 [Streptomyces mangrovisoli]|uniref:Uncharacterized protein n=1 Tax=Streptomyces mangrovisoli TaxID=1428628 RepID=A0A1J4NT34_9ACTN|nr:hypothetical protein WN71_029765 [Streptomyces mangrovisoli]